MRSREDVLALDAVGQAELVRRGDVSAAELIEAAIARVEATRELNAVVTDLFDLARERAARPLPDAPLAGVPFLLKDLGGTLAGVRETMGSVALRDHVPAYTAWTVQRYLDAGLVPLGKTNTPEFGNHATTEPRLFGATRNPAAPERSAGGSSGGSAAAVAAGLVAVATGGDGTGSIRIPASCCGVVGLKPRRGRKSFAPTHGEHLFGLVNEHVLTRSVRDTALLLDLSAGEARGDPYTAPPPARPFLEEVSAGAGRLRVGACAEAPFGPTGAECRAALADAARLLDGLGHDVRDAAPACDPERVLEATSVVWAAGNLEVLAFVARTLGRDPLPDELEPSTWELVEDARRLSPLDVVEAVTSVHAIGRAFATSLEDVDVLLVPTLATLPPPPGLLNRPRGSARAFFAAELAVTGWTALANLSGWAAISLPLHLTDDGVPVGVQLMAPDEAPLLRLAGQLEARRPWPGADGSRATGAPSAR